MRLIALVIVTATAFYIGAYLAWRARCPGTSRRIALLGEAALAVIWLAFLQAYALRAFASPMFAFLGLALIVGYVGHVRDRR